MHDYIDIKGVSGASYRFMRFRDGRPLSPAGGNFLYGRYTGARFELLYAGEVQNLLKDSRSRWDEARSRFQASDLYTRLNLSERVRQLEHGDIVQANAPPMNLDGEWPARGRPSDAFAGRSEQGVELEPRSAAGKPAESPLGGELAGGAEEMPPCHTGQAPADADPPHA